MKVYVVTYTDSFYYTEISKMFRYSEMAYDYIELQERPEKYEVEEWDVTE